MTTSSTFAKIIDEVNYRLNSSKTATVVSSTNKYPVNIVIPEKVKGDDGVEYTVVGLEDKCFYDCFNLTSITLPSTITTMGISCFEDCKKLTSITLPSSLTTIGNRCFYGCSGLTSIEIPSNVASLGDYCFDNCTGLTSIIIPPSVQTIGKYSFCGCSCLTSITVPASVTSIGEWCFAFCSNLTSITLPSSINSLGYAWFSKCSNLTSITIPISVTSIESNCFSECTSLTSIVIPSSVNYIGSKSFKDCKALKSVFFKGKVPNNISNASISTESVIYVPKDNFQDYKDALGSNYQIFIWNTEELGDGDNPAAQCETPIVSYESGNLKFTCETSGVKYYYTISDYDIATNALSEDGIVSLSAAYNILVYATADGYRDSKITKATLYWVDDNQDNPSNINLSKTRGIVASAHNGIVSLSGLNNGEEVKFYSFDGKYLGATVAVNGYASYAVSESMVIAKVGNNSIKIAMQ